MKHDWFSFLLAVLSLSCANRIAVRPVESAQERDRNSAHFYFELGQRFRQQGDSNRAEEYLRLALDLGFPAERGLAALLRVCLEAGRLRSALDYAERRLKAHPTDNSLRQLVATIHMALGDSAKAIHELEEVLSRDPQAASAHFFAAVVYETEFANYASAQDHFRSYLVQQPNGLYAAEATSRLRAWTFDRPLDDAGPKP
jgi:tetratricopeptide (TPR) repeat protein